jgi:transcriptional regulator with XRE-family HTH domain
MIGNRLRLAREAAGLSLRAMEDAISGKVSARAGAGTQSFA